MPSPKELLDDSQTYSELGFPTGDKDNPRNAVLRDAALGVAAAVPDLINSFADTGKGIYDFTQGNPYEEIEIFDLSAIEEITEGSLAYEIPKALTQFAIPFAGWGKAATTVGVTSKAIKGVKAKAAFETGKAAIVGGLADITAFKAYEDNFFNLFDPLLDKYPSLNNPIHDYLRATTPEEAGFAEAKIRQFVSGIVPGEIIGLTGKAAFKGGQVLKGLIGRLDDVKANKEISKLILGRWAKDNGLDVDGILPTSIEDIDVSKIKKVYAASDDIDNLGDEILPEIDSKTTGRQKILPGTPHPTDAKKVRGYEGRWVTKKHFDQVTKSREGADKIKEQVLGGADQEQPPKLDLTTDTRGKGEFYHGAADEFELDDSGHFSTDTGIYGQGLYATDDLTTAGKYQKKNRKIAGKDASKTIYKVEEKTPVNFYDLDQPLDDEILELLQDAAKYRDGYVDEAIELVTDFDKKELTLTNLLNTLRGRSEDFNVTRSEFQDIVDTFKDSLRAKGFGGFTHQGGNLAGKGKRLHQVKIYWEPKDQLNITKVDTGGGGAVPPRKPPAGSSGADVPPVDPTDPKVQTTFNPKFLPDLDVEKLILDEAEKVKNLDASGKWPHRRTFKDMVNSANQLLPKEVIEQARLFTARYGRGGESDLPATLIAMNQQMNRNAIALDNVAKAIENTLVTGNKEGFAELKEQLIRETKTLDGLITLNKPLKTIPAQTLAANKAAGGLADTVATADDLAGRQVVQGAMEDASKEISEVTVKAQETLQEILDAAEKGDVASIRKIRKITKRIQAAGGDPEKLRKMIRPDYMKKGFEINNELFINAILSGPETHAVNILSTALNTVVRPVDQILGSALTADMTGMIRGGKELYYLTTAVSDSWKMARAAFRTENNILNAGAMIDDREAAKRFAIRMDGEGTVANLVNGFGRFVRYSGRFLLAEDEFFKQLNFRSYVKASAWENGVRNGLEGDKLKQYIKDQFDSTIEIVNTNSMKDVKDEALLDLYDKAQQYAAETTFTADLPKGSFGGDVQSFINKHPSARTFFPFIRTPINIFKAQMRRTAFVAPFMDEYRQALKSSDPSIAAKARGELIVGSTIWTVGISTATAINDPLSEVAITGGGPADYKFLNQMRETGWQPYSFRFLEKDKDGQPIIGQDGKPKYKYVSYKRFDPWASFLMMSADMAAIMGQLNKEDREDLATVAGVAMARNITNKTYLQGVSELAQILSEDWKQIGNWLPKRIAATVPYSALGRSIKKAVDPTIMDKRIRPGDEGMIALRKLHNELAATVPGYGDLKPIQNFITGSLVEYPPGYGPDIMNIMNPIKETNSLNNSVLTTLVDIGARIEKPKDELFGGIKLNSDQYSDLVNDIAFVKIGGQRMVHSLHKTMQHKDIKALLATARGENITAANQDISVAAQEEARADAEQIFRKIINAYKKAGREQWLRKPENRELALKYDAEINAINEARSNSVLDNFKQLQGATN